MIATTTGGKVEGLERDGALQFRGIPFASPPTADRRFRLPEPVEPWDGVRDATSSGPVAPQTPSPTEAMMGAPPMRWDEDCLTLTVTTPALDDGERPVMVWIHGGAFVAGTGSMLWYDGARLATRGDVVTVAINYRLGALGFTHLGHLLGEEFADTGCLGLHDQLAALRWVRDNIASFGGDPGNVTVFGESAGGMSVGCLVGSPLSRDLFRNAVPQSGAMHNVTSRDRAEEITALLLQHAGLTERTADGLLSLTAENVLAAQSAASLALLADRGLVALGSGLPFQPVVGGTALPRPPLDALRDGAAADVRLLTGNTTEEWKLFGLIARGSDPLDRAGLVARSRGAVGEPGAAIAEAYAANRRGASPDDVWSAIATDGVFRVPAVRMAEAQAAHQPDTFVYEFGHRSTAWGGALGACHAVEIAFVFDNVHKRGVDTFVGEIGDAERALATQTSDAWLAFAKGGAPWQRYETSARSTMRLGGEDAGLHENPRADELALWDGVL